MYHTSLKLFDILKLSMFKEARPSFGMDSGTSEIISRLKFIGRIQKGEKINVKYMYVQPDNWTTSISRTLFASDNRLNCYNFIDTTVKRSFEIINLNKTSEKLSERCLVINIIKDIKDALQGITNLKDTYNQDVMFCCKLDTIIQDTTSRLVELEQSLDCSPSDPEAEEVVD